MPTSKAKMKTLTDVPWQRKGCRHSKEFRRDRQSYMGIGKESQTKCLWLGAQVFVLPVASLWAWDFGAWPMPFFFVCSYFTGAFLHHFIYTDAHHSCNRSRGNVLQGSVSLKLRTWILFGMTFLF